MGNTTINENNNNQNNLYSSSKFSTSNPPMYVGLILDVPNIILDQLIRFDEENSFLENFFSEFEGEIITLINGNEKIPYYDFNKLLLSSINYLLDYNKNNNNNLYDVMNFFNFDKKNLFDQHCLQQIVKGMGNDKFYSELTHSKIIYNNILRLKDILKANFSSFLQNFFENFNKFISKPSSINLSFKKIFELLIYTNKYTQNKYIIIISDGNSKQNDDQIIKI